MPKIEEDGKSWLRRPKLYKRDVEPYKKKTFDVPVGRKVSEHLDTFIA